MDRNLSLLGAAAVAALMIGTNMVGTGTANAADLLPPPPVVEAPEVKTKAGGWYLRGDISYDFQDLRGFDDRASGQHYNPHHDNAFGIGAGIGYQVNNNFRVDLTGEYFFDAGVDFSTGSSTLTVHPAPGYTGGFANGVCPGTGIPTGGAIVSSSCESDEHAEVSKFKLLANAYYDIGTFGGFTPYIGAGIGGAYVSYGDLTTKETCTVTVTVPGQYCPDPHAPVQATALTQTTTATRSDFEGESEWRFAWALHAGGSYALTENVKLDLGYSYNRIEGGKAFTLKDGPGINPGVGGIYDDGFTNHTIRAGLRYHIW